MKMIAKTTKGKEFIYSKTAAFSVSDAAATEICAALNDNRYQLSGDQCWHIYDCGWYEKEFTNAGCQKIARRKGNIYIKRCYY